MKSNITQVMDHASDHIESLVRSGISEILSMLFYKNGFESYVPFDKIDKLVDAMLSYMDDLYDTDSFGEYKSRNEVESLVNEIKEMLGIPRI